MKKIILILIVLLLALPPVYAEVNVTEEYVGVTIPEFDVKVNGHIIDNSTEPYPFLLYKGITYFPMTWDLSCALGLKLKWDNTTKTLDISKRDDVIVYEQSESIHNDIGRILSAKIVTNTVVVNGEVIDNKNEKYPLLNFRNITYFPMTWDYMVEEFNSGYRWNNDTGFAVSADPRLKVLIPKPHTFTLTSSLTEIKERKYAVKDMIYIEENTTLEFNDITVNVTNNFSPLFNDYIMYAEIDLYNVRGDYIHTNRLLKSFKYDAGEHVTNYPITTSFGSLATYDKFVVRVTFIPPSLARADYDQNYQDIDVEFVDGVFDLYKYKREGAFSMRSSHAYKSLREYDDDLMAYALLLDKGMNHINGEYFMVSTSEDGIINYGPVKDRYTRMGPMTSLYIDPLGYSRNLRAAAGDNIIYDGYSSALYLYDVDGNLLKLVINESEYE